MQDKARYIYEVAPVGAFVYLIFDDGSETLEHLNEPNEYILADLAAAKDVGLCVGLEYFIGKGFVVL